MENARRAGVKTAAQLPVEGGSVPWRTRLELRDSTHGPEDAHGWMEQSVVPALNEVAEELATHGVEAKVETDRHRVWIEVDHGDKPHFIYGLEPNAYEGANLPLSGDADEEDEHFSRAEVFLSEGGQHYCIFGYTKTQIIRDLLRHYERRLHWIHHLVNVG